MSDLFESSVSLQDTFAATSTCFGCGPANQHGLRLKSFVQGDLIVARWLPEKKYEAFSGNLNGGIIGALLDCHCNWTAAYHLMRRDGLMDSEGAEKVPCTVTAEYQVKFHNPTDATGEVALSAYPIKLGRRAATISGALSVQGEVTATCEAVFVSVKSGHPAYHRW